MRARLAALAMALGGCAPASSGCEATPLDGLDARLAAAYCDCVPWLTRLALGHEPADCASEMTAFLAEGQIGHLRAGVAAGTMTFRSDAAASELCALEACEPSALDGSVRYRLAVGASADGGPCAYPEDCSLTSTCSPARGCTGTCIHLPQIGEPCATNGQCHNPVALERPQLWCVHGSCAAVPSVGETCTSDGGCAAGLTCQVPNGMPGTCVVPPPVRGEGEACGPVGCPAGFSTCASITCASDLVCIDAGTGGPPTCARSLNDGTCRAVYDHQGSDCRAGDTCEGATASTTGTCTPPPAEGEACASVFSLCADALRCARATLSTSGTCVRVRHLGAPCGDDWDCVSNFCEAGQCAIPPACE